MHDPYDTLLLAGEIDSNDSSAVDSWCSLLLSLCEQISASGQSTWDSGYRRFVEDRSSGWNSELGATVEKNLKAYDSLRHAADEMLRECRNTDGSLNVEILRNRYLLASEAQRAAQQAQHQQAAPGQPNDPLAEYKDQQYHTFQDGMRRVWVEAANTFLTADELVEWNHEVATARLTRAWAAVEGRLPPGTALTPEQRERALRMFIKRKAAPSDDRGGAPAAGTTNPK